jgi:hypothetical protein
LFLKGLLQPRRQPKCLLLKMLKLIQTWFVKKKSCLISVCWGVPEKFG